MTSLGFFFPLLEGKKSIPGGIRRRKLEATFSDGDAGHFKIRYKSQKYLAEKLGKVWGRR